MAWLPGYAYRKPLVLTGGASGAQTDFQLDIDIAYVAAKMQADVDDIRFTQNDGTTLIDAWLESKVDSASAKTWVEFPTTPANTVEQTYYMYYGKAVASDWDIGATFIVGDDFEVAGAGDWTTVSGSPDYDNTTQAKSPTHSLQLDVGAAWETVTIPLAASDDIAIDMWLYCDHLNRAGNLDSVVIKHGNGSKRITILSRNDQNIYYVDTDYRDSGLDIVLDAWKHVSIYDIDWTAGTFTINYDGNTANCDMQTAATESGVMRLDVNTASTYLDDVRVRKYAANPPTYAFGAEQESPYADLSISQVLTTSQAAYASTIQALPLSQIASLQSSASAAAQAQLPLSQIASLQSSASAAAQAQLPLSQALAFITTAFKGADAALPLSQVLTVSQAAAAAAQAQLPINQVLTISPLAAAIADADLTISETLALTTAYLIAVPTPLERTVFILAENRTTKILAEDRTHIIASEDRTLFIPEENRTLTIPEEDRTLIMIAP